MPRSAVLVALALAAAALTGCLSGTDGGDGAPDPDNLTTPDVGEPRREYAAMGFDGKTWPDLKGAKVTVLAYSSFGYAFGDLAASFENRTNGTVELVTEEDAGSVLQRAVREKGSPTFDVVYGVDNVLAGKALREGVFEAYEPVLADRVDPAYAFLPNWEATPVTHGYIAINVDPRAGLDVEDLDDVREHAGEFVTEDPRTSTPGLGFLVATVATYGDTASDDDGYDYIDYWNDLFEGGVLVAADWTQAYVGHFTGGYGQFEEGAQVDKPIVTSYTTSPAYEVYYEYDTLNGVVTAPNSTFHQIQLMGIAAGTKNRAAAEAWIEFALTDEFQAYAAPGEAIYPVVEGVGTDDVFGENDPEPGTFEPAGFTHEELDENVERWLREWTDAYERSRAG